MVLCAAGLAAVGGGSAGCGGGAGVSGAPFFNTRLIKLGETLEIRLPFDRLAGREWSIDSYDSLYLGYQGRTLVMDDDSKGTLIVRFVTKTPGETSLTLRRRYGANGTKESLENYTINILQN